MKRTITLVPLAVALLSVAPSAQILDGIACLDGTQEIPPNTSAGTGSGRFELDLVSLVLTYNITYSGLSSAATAAHLHFGDCGAGGPIEIALPPASPIVGSVLLTGAQAGAVVAGDWYINIHTVLFPGGEIRGNLDFDGSSSCVPCGLSSCFSPDGLNGLCWEPALADLPDLGAIELPAAGICWDACDPLPVEDAQIFFSPPVETTCGQFLSDVTVSDAAGIPLLFGTATLDYTRTWEESAPPGVDRDFQVWRFVVKVDFGETPSTPTACYKPPCMGPVAPQHRTSFWYGYVDYAENCFTGNFENALALFHNCDDFIHNPFLSDKPTALGFHPDSVYAVVAPHTAANPFVPAVITPRSGDLIAEAVRNVGHPLVANACTTEEPVLQGQLQLLGTACLCPLDFVPPMQSASRFTGVAACGSSWLSIQLQNLTVGFKWFDVIMTSLGTWSTDLTYPGREQPFAAEAFLIYHDSCAEAFGLPADTLDMVYGAKTNGGYAVTTSPLRQTFLDVASNYSEPFVALPLLGSVRPTEHLIYVNTD